MATIGGGRPNFFPDDDDEKKKKKQEGGDNHKDENPPCPQPEPEYHAGVDDDDEDDHWLPPFDLKQAQQEEENRVAEERARPTPWPMPVDGADLLDDIRRYSKDYTVLPTHADVACALWAAHTFVSDLFEYTPRLFIRAAGSGKTTLLELLEKLVFQPVLMSDVTGAGLLRLIEEHFTLLVDEHDSMPYSDSIRNVFNSGFKRSGKTVRAGKIYQTFAPFALASNAKLHPTMEDRSIIIRLKPKLKTEKIKDLRDLDGVPVRRKFLRWARDNRTALQEAKPQFPSSIFSRRADTWGPLLAIADVAGGEWPRLSRKAAVALSIKHSQTDLNVLLLHDIREAFGEAEAMSSEELVRRLTAKADAPWAAQGLNQWSLAEKLEAFEIYPKRLRIGSSIPRGYRREMFGEAWQRWGG